MFIDCTMCGARFEIPDETPRPTNTCPDCSILLDNPKPRAAQVVVFPSPSGDSNRRVYHTRAVMGEAARQWFMDVPGVNSAHVEPYRAEIEKGQCFEWDEIHLRIIDVITGGAQEDVVLGID